MGPAEVLLPRPVCRLYSVRRPPPLDILIADLIPVNPNAISITAWAPGGSSPFQLPLVPRFQKIVHELREERTVLVAVEPGDDPLQVLLGNGLATPEPFSDCVNWKMSW